MSPGDAGESLLSYSDPYYFCLMGWNAKWTRGPVPLPPNRTGCVMSAACESCLAAEGTLINASFGKSYHISSCPEDCFPDGVVADEVARRITAHFASQSVDVAGPAQPLFATLGMRNPHLPWYAPKAYVKSTHFFCGKHGRECERCSLPLVSLLCVNANTYCMIK